jgi:BirA family biotin operon repressor/biotin-[acetyl-CoA-carboxylase] ligase
MINEVSLKKTLSNLPIGKLRYFDSIGSTNDEALAWANDGAPDLSLVIADEQTSGRGRLNRKWFTPAGSAIAASLILRPEDSLRPYLSRVVGLAALSIAETCKGLNLDPQIKWPNDILVNGKKLAGILIENIWTGDRIDSLVIGMGINVHKESVPPLEVLQFPATSMEDELGATAPAREEILHGILKNFIERSARIGTDEFLKAWGDLLAFRGGQVQVRAGEDTSITGELLGLETDGGLQLRDAHGRIISIRYGDVSLRTAA